uniref:Uncharacterized protein n=1 Tax=Arundo donax TaxID=35708 RepID=A0A0A9E0B4_ARUDO
MFDMESPYRNATGKLPMRCPLRYALTDP